MARVEDFGQLSPPSANADSSELIEGAVVWFFGGLLVSIPWVFMIGGLAYKLGLIRDKDGHEPDERRDRHDGSAPPGR